jgi:hypothetical protein
VWNVSITTILPVSASDVFGTIDRQEWFRIFGSGVSILN